jgi:hypothetical protein
MLIMQRMDSEIVISEVGVVGKLPPCQNPLNSGKLEALPHVA